VGLARKTGQVIKNLVGSSISASYISFNTDIAESVIESFRNRKLNDEYPVIYIDATYIPLFRNNVAKEAVYVVLGLRNDGKREILGYFLPGGEEKATVWKEVLFELKNRGLKGVKMIISDDLAGLDEAIREVFPDTEHQLCWFHLKKNIKNKTRAKDFDEIMKDLEHDVLESKTEEEARQRMLSFIDKWSKLYRYFNNLKSKVKNYCYFFKFYPNIRSYLRTTNWLERCFKELKDNIRTRGYFQSEPSANKFLYLFFSEKDSAFRSRKLRYSAMLEEAFNG